MKLNEETGRYEAEGSYPDLLNALASTMNFTYTIGPPPDNKWGGKQSDGSWNGMMNQVVNEKIDFGKMIFFMMKKKIVFNFVSKMTFIKEKLFVRSFVFIASS